MFEITFISGMVGEERPSQRVRAGRVELAEVAAEREQLRVGELLAADADHQVLEPRRTDLREELRLDRLGEVQAPDFGAERFA